MAKKSYKKNAAVELQTDSIAVNDKENNVSFWNRFKVPVLLFLFAFALYANTFTNGYASDDTLVITSNKFTQKGISGLKEIFTNDAFVGFFGERGKTLVAGGRYRPLSIASFALEIEFFGKNKPGTSHIINAVLYGLCIVIIYFLLLEYFEEVHEKRWWLSIPFLIALIYAAHPIHTEAVANIKGRDEILGMLFSMLAVFFTLRYVKTKQIKFLLAFSSALMLAYLSKENAITMIAVVFVSYYVFTQATASQYFKTLVAYAVPTAFFLFIRAHYTSSSLSKFTKELMNDPFLLSTPVQKVGTLFYTFITYLKLQIVPFPLTHDYYPYQIPKVSLDNAVVILSVVINVGLFCYAAYSIYKRRSKLGFAIMFYFITFSVVSQVFFTVGTTMNERFVFMPSLGIVMALVLCIDYLSKRYNEQILYVALCIVPIYMLITIDRNPVWKNDATLFLHDIHISTNSAKLNLAVGGVLIDSANTRIDTVERKEMLTRAIVHLEKAIEIYGDTTLIVDNTEVHIGYANAYNLLGNAHYFLNGDLVSAEKAYKMANYYNPGHFDSYQNLVTIFYNSGKFAESIPLLKSLIETQPSNASYHFKLGDAYKNTQNYDSAIASYQKTLTIGNNEYGAIANYNIGLCYARYKNDLANGIIYLSKSCELDPTNINCNEDLGVALAVSGRPAEAITYLKKCLVIDPNYKNALLNITLAYKARGMIDSANYYNSILGIKQ